MDSNLLITENFGLVHMCANKFRDRGIEYEELYSAGCLGLVKASKRFDEKLGYAFSTYAVPVILGVIRQCFRNDGSIRVSRDLKDKARRCREILEKLENEKGRAVGIAELSEKMNMEISDVAEILNSLSPVVSIDDAEFTETTAQEKSFESESINRIAVEELMNYLDERDRELIRLRYFEEKTQAQVADILEMTQVQVSRRERSLLSDMRRRMAA